VLADQLGLDAISEVGAKSVTAKDSLEEYAETAEWVVPLFEAAERHPTAGGVWSKVRGGIAQWLNLCPCDRCDRRIGDRCEDPSCRLKTCSVERLSYESLVNLVGYLAGERAANSPAKQFEWASPRVADIPRGEHYTCPEMALGEFRFELRVYPNGISTWKRPALMICPTGAPTPHRICASHQRSSCLAAYHPELGYAASDAYFSRTLYWTESGDGTITYLQWIWLTKSTARRDMLLQWAHGNGLPHSDKSEAALLHFFATQYSLNEVVSDALLCHMAPLFSVANAGQFAQLPPTAMLSLLSRDDLDVSSETEVVEALKPWAEVHTSAELQQLVPALRLAWIPTKELVSLLTDAGSLLSPLKDNAAVQQLVEDALDAQTTAGSKRRREAEGPPDQFTCPITQDIMSDPVIAADGHSYERAAIARWLQSHETSPKTNQVLQNKHLLPNHGLKSLILQHLEQLNASEQRANKRTKFAATDIPKASKLELLASR